MSFPGKLAAANIRSLHRKNAEGIRPIDELYDQATVHHHGGQKPATSVQEKYFAVFSQALECFMGSFVLDYVEEVCGDSQLTAPDPVDASLLDGALVKEWCERELAEQEALLQSALKSEPLFSQLVTGCELQRQASKAHALVSVLKALGRIRGEPVLSQGQLAAGGPSTAGPSISGVQAELCRALLLEQALQMLSWCVRQGLTGQPGTCSARTGVHASMPEWLRRVQSRRERRPGHGLFLDDMLQALRVPGGYPFSSIAHAVYLLGCVVRDASGAAFTAKLGVLAYYLMDLTGDSSVGPDGSCSPLLADLAAAFHLPLATVAAWQAAFLLDAAPQAASQPLFAHHQQPPPGEVGTELGRACALLVAHTQPELPIKFIEVLLGACTPIRKCKSMAFAP
ncbi:hypothetical protein DUNSADRAFT_10226 [Dunaliella salina]|uniref:ELYS-like domain-containing protein n=1 Tax=Dunaliella salina TaxID=3046 RepID=A0ABQ7GFT8_DUNSA|nr:hypothetical protein DUNSADRAFT_10226 [Dunaliella salina]|eukprot:KAF5833472.1 hypothetical protein DUNSADRAFT_10226 [Dunaliella salina]